MREYSIVAVLWEDHIAFSRATLIKNPNKVLIPSLSIGFLFKETDDAIILVSDLERYREHDDANYMVIVKSCIKSIKKYGTIKLANIRCEEG